ncbi:hypothetical protein MUW33_2134A [Mycobacterium canetti]|nr:hypothetical protein MUW33_2134A [Mycobacterium canetti]
MTPGMQWAAKTDHLAIVLLPRHHRRYPRRGRAIPARLTLGARLDHRALPRHHRQSVGNRQRPQRLVRRARPSHLHRRPDQEGDHRQRRDHEDRRRPRRRLTER